MSTAGVADFFTFDAVLLRGESERCKGGKTNGCGVGRSCRVGLISILEGDICKTERLAGRVFRRVGVFSRA